MKKTIILLSALAALVACNKENTQPESTPTVFKITITREDDTKDVKSAWEDGDVVYIFFSTVAAPNYVKYSYSSGAWTNKKIGTINITTDGTMTAIYLPFGNGETVQKSGPFSGRTGQKQYFVQKTGGFSARSICLGHNRTL